ncbi:hypothetical protein JKL49_18580 [Phenylobacterium sp. 20VBR1]|uniref:Uncharacterized protein n=1 Tax=Phenylobacterium glaciei TaxID=2803784 RepID=A0A941HXS5_9CAUL|nr:hypothetical protein [Phenylobacterium glaciei]MBR7621406.1 hypothetical protein [Phenylobacterium glaciei]QQZ50034.1 hypothetical protein JKL49_25930 [Phenylobacterium glaciei]
MRTLLISATLLALAGATPVLAQSYAHATSQYDDRQDSRYEDRQAPQSFDRGGQAYDGRGAAPGGDYGYQDAGQGGGYRDQGAYRQDRYRPAPRHHHRRASAAVSRYTASGRPVYYNDGMIRTGRDFPAGTVGLNGY